MTRQRVVCHMPQRLGKGARCLMAASVPSGLDGLFQDLDEMT